MSAWKKIAVAASFALTAALAATGCSSADSGTEDEADNAIVAAGPMCGGIAGLLCPEGFTCKMTATHPDASGRCVRDVVPEWAACSRDADCIAVPDHDPCTLDGMKAINKDKKAEYAALVSESDLVAGCAGTFSGNQGVPQCNTGARRCELVKVQDIRCGGHSINPHSCPDGFRCEGPGLAVDAPGKCVEGKPAEPEDKCGGTCGASSRCSFCWGNWACLPNGAMC